MFALPGGAELRIQWSTYENETLSDHSTFSLQQEMLVSIGCSPGTTRHALWQLSMWRGYGQRISGSLIFQSSR